MKKKTNPESVFDKDLREVKTAGFKANKREKNVNRRAGLQNKKNKTEGVTQVKRRKPLALKHVRRMRKAALALSCVFVGSVAVVGVGFFTRGPVEDLPEVDYATVCLAPPKDGSTPVSHTLVDNVAYMNHVLQNQPYWSSEMESTVFTVMQQRVYTYKQYYNGVLISADIAKGVSSEATQFCVTDEVVLWRSAANKNFDGMNTPWSTKEPQGLTISQFKQKRGLPPSEFSVYILNEKTIKNALDYSVTENTDGTYEMTLDLYVNTGDGETSADYFYKQQMLVTGGLDEHPVISETQVTYVFDSDWRILSFTIRDSYNAKMGISVHCTSETNTVFNYEEEKAVNTFYDDYFKQYEDNFVQAADPSTNEPNALNYLAAAFGNVLSDGATFRLGLTVDNLDLSGVVHVGLADGALNDVRVVLGDIGIYVDDNLTLYVTDGKAKYKLGIGSMLTSTADADDADAIAGLDVNAIVDQLTKGVFTVDGDVTTLETNLEIFGLEIALTFEFDTKNGIELGYVSAEIPFNGMLIKARLEYGTEDDIPEVPADIAEYNDILNEGISLQIALSLDNLKLDGIAQIVMENGMFAGVRAELGEFGIYYDCPANMLYITDGNTGFKFSLAELGGSDFDFGALNLNSVIAQIIENLTTGEGTVSTGATLEILEQTITAALGVKLTGGIEINADFELFGKNVKATIGLTDETVALPDFSGYIDVLNEGITLNVNLTLDGLTLEGAVYIGLKDGKLTEIRADFGEVEVYYIVVENELYLRVGTTKAMLALGKAEDASAFDVPALLGGDVSSLLGELLGNLTTALKEVSVNADISLLDSVIPASITLNFEDGISVSAAVSMLGIDVSLGIQLNGDNETVPPLADKENYIDVLKEGWLLADSLLGENITATVKGSVYGLGEEKYAFRASLEYDKGYTLDENGEKVINGFPVHVDTGVKEEGSLRTGMNFYIDSTLYLHFNLLLEAKSENADSLYLDVYLMDATPVSSTNGKTDGGYYADGVLDVYLTVSKYAPDSSSYDPLKLYAPVDEIMTLVSMVASAANVDKIQFKDNEELTAAVAEISNIINQLLIDAHIPYTKDQFAALGESLIPQIFGGLSLSDILNKLIGEIDETVEDAQSRGFRLDESYIKSITHGDDSLKIVLDSSAVYGVSTDGDITAELNRGNIGGVNRLTDVRLDNVYFGDDNCNKLDIALSLGYDEIEKPSALGAYLNLDGIDTLLKAIVNSATHETEGDIKYDLNHYYLLNGSVTAGISVIGININATIQIKSLAVYIDENNEVSIDAHIYYDGVQELNQIAIDGDADVYISMRGGRIFIKRIKYNHYVKSGLITNKVSYNPALVEFRGMTLDEFSANLMDNLTFIFNFGPVITDNLENSGSSSSGGLNFDGYDLGKTVSSILSSYTFEETSAGASWTVSICGSLLTSLTGMTSTDIPIKFSAIKNADGTYTVTNLDILQTTLNLFGSVVKLKLSGGLTYCNPHEIMGGYVDTSKNLFALTATVDSKFDFCGAAQQIGEYGSQIKLPLGLTFTEDGQRYMLDGYTVNGAAYTFESYVEENGVEYGVTTFTDDIAFTAVWNKIYNVSFLDESGAELYNVTYHENDVLSAQNTPEIPARYGYDGEWSGAFGTAVTGNLSFTLSYSPVKYAVSFIDGNDVTVLERSYGLTIGLADLETNTHLAQYIYDENGNRFEEITVEGVKTYYVSRTGKSFKVVYVSDIAYSGSALDTLMQFGDDTDCISAVSADGVLFLGWYVYSGSGYKYIADAAALKDVLSQNYLADGSTVTLYAAWVYDNITMNITEVSGSQWGFYGTYSLTFVEGVSAEIAASAGVECKVSFTYYAHGKAGIIGGFKNFTYDNIGSQTVSGTSGSLQKTGMNCAYGVGGSGLKGSITAQATFSVGGRELAKTGSFEQFCNKS